MPPKPSPRWAILVGAIIIGLSASLLLAVIFGVSLGKPVVAFAVLGLCIGTSAVLNSLWDWWKAR